MSFLATLFGDPNKKIIEKLKPIVQRINALEEQLTSLSDEELRGKTTFFRERLKNGEDLEALLPEGFAVCREASKRVLGQRHYDVQLMGGMMLHRGYIAEMRTGEGKTLTATLAVYLNALEGKGVHVVTVNDYLARRDAAWMGRVYHALGLTVGSIQHESAFLYDPDYRPEETDGTQEENATHTFRVDTASLRPCSRKESYGADITYGTNNEFGFDYLRDNLVADLSTMVQRELNYAIVDEVDSILIDEARTPLIISGPAEESTEMYNTYARVISRLKETEDYTVDEKMRAATFTEEGMKNIENMLGMGNIYTLQNLSAVRHLEQALKAQALFKKDKDYVVKEGDVIIVDEFTGRLMHGRRYSEGLHQAIEAKEGMRVQRESKTYATVTFQNLFRLYKKLSGMTGTAATEAEEFAKIYKLEVVTIPTHRDMIRDDLSDRIYKNERGKFSAVVAEIKERHEKGQPVLVGTISIEKNEMLSALLEREGIPHAVLNAKNHEREAEIIAQAGRLGAVTIATNMAGRGVDIILGGTPPDDVQAQKVRNAGGLHVLGTERHESRRIDNQLRGRSGRQGDPGSTQFYISMEDDLMRIFGSERMKKMMDTLGIPEDMPIENKIVSGAIEESQRKVEGHNFDIRKHLVEYDDVINKQRDIIYKRRREILNIFDSELKGLESEKTLKGMIVGMVEEEIEHLVAFHTNVESGGDVNLGEITAVVNTIFPLPSDATDTITREYQMGDKLTYAQSRTRIIDYLVDIAKQRYVELEEHIVRSIAAVQQDMDGSLAFRMIEKDMLIHAIDALWMEHLEAIEHLRAGIGLRGYGQRDPLVEYKKESFRLFSELISLINKEVVYAIYKIGAAPSRSTQQKSMPKNLQYSAPIKTGDAAQQQSEKSKVGRNDPCPCDSGKKYKRCHGA